MKMVRNFSIALLSALLLHCWAAPTTYDQRQEGDLNVKVDLDNFVIVVARPSASSSMDLLGSMSQLFTDINRRGSPFNAPAQSDLEAKSQEFESKSSPEESTKALDDVSMEPQEKKIQHLEEETIVVVQEGEKAARSLESIARTLRNLRIKDGLAKKEKDKVTGKYKFVAIESVDDPANLRLVGDAIENCGPGRIRNKSGVCQQE